MISIRHGEMADIETAVSIYERSSLAYHQGNWPNRFVRIEYVRHHLADPTTQLLLAFEDERPVGMASTQPFRSDDGNGPVVPESWYLGYLFVDPECWNKGIGGTLLDTLLAKAKQSAVSRVYLLTYEDNERAQRLYRSRGFHRTGRVNDLQGEWVCETQSS